MALARYQSMAQDDAGNVLASPSVEVRLESSGALASLFSDRAGAVGIANPFTGASDGLIGFHVVGGAYKVIVTKDATTRTFRYVAVGTSSETDYAAGLAEAPNDGLQYCRESLGWTENLGGGVWTNLRLAKTANYTVLNADKGKTIALGGGALFTLTFGAASGYDANFALVAVNEDSVRAKTITASGITTFTLWPGQSAVVFNQNNMWQVIREKRWVLPAAQTIYVDTTSGVDSVTHDGMSSGSAYLTIEYAYAIVRNQWDLNANVVTCQLIQNTTSITLVGYILLLGKLVGQTYPNQFNINGNGISTTTITNAQAGGFCFGAQQDAHFQIANMKLVSTGAGGGGLIVSDGHISFTNVSFDIRNNAAIDAAGHNSRIEYGGGAWWIESTTNCNTFAVAEDAAIVALGGSPGLTIAASPSWSNAFVQGDLGGIIEGTGFTQAAAGAPNGPRYNSNSLGIIFTSGGNSGWGTGTSFFPGSSAGAGGALTDGFYG